MVFGVFATMQNSVVRADTRSRTSDQLRLAAVELDRQVRSGNVVYDPAAETGPDIVANMSLRIYTQADYPTAGSRCVQWKITSQQTLQSRYWTVDWQGPAGVVSGWRTVADHILNRSATPTVAAFTLDTSQSAYGHRLVKIAFVANLSNGMAGAGSDAEVDTSVAARNADTGFSSSSCASVPPG
jgi:hypothetical protein